MSKRVCVTFSGRAYDETTKLIVENAPKFGADEVRVYDDRWLLETYPEYRSLNRWLWETKDSFGFGWCAWKAFVICHAIARGSPLDTVLYTDADTYPIADLSPLFAIAERDGMMLFEAQGCSNRQYTRRDCFVAMGCDEERYWNARHACGRFQVFRAGDYRARQLLMEWLVYSINPMCQLRAPSVYAPDFPEFTRHSNEQSVLTILAEKYRVPLHREACQFGWPAQAGYGQPEDTYPQLFHQVWTGGDRADLSGSSYRNV